VPVKVPGWMGKRGLGYRLGDSAPPHGLIN